jgi:hypothetical protein
LITFENNDVTIIDADEALPFEGSIGGFWARNEGGRGSTWRGRLCLERKRSEKQADAYKKVEELGVSADIHGSMIVDHDENSNPGVPGVQGEEGAAPPALK